MNNLEAQKSSGSWKTYVLGFIGFLALVVVLLPCLIPIHFNFGATSITIQAGIARGALDFPERKFGFCSDGWDGPTGDFSHGESHGFKAYKWVYRIDKIEDPKAYVQDHLPHDIPGLLKAVDDTNFLVQQAAAQALGERRGAAKEILPGLISSLGRDNEIAKDSIQKIAQLNINYAVPLLANCITNENSFTRNNAIEILGELGPSATNAVPALLQSLANSPTKTKIICALSVAKIDRHIAAPVPVLIEIIKNSDTKFHAGAIYALSEFGLLAGPSAPGLIPLLKSPDKNIRTMAARTLGIIGPAAHAAIPLLIENLNEEDEDALMWTIKALGQFGREAKDAIPQLAKLAETEQERGRWSIEALGEMGPDAVPFLLNAFTNGQYRQRGFAAYSLAKIGPEATNALPALIDALGDDEPGRANLALKVLGRIGPAAKSAMPRILKLMNGEDETLRLRAAQAAWRIDLPKEKVIPLFIEALQGHSEQRLSARSVAIHALGEIGPEARQALPLLREESISKDPRSHTSLQDDALMAIQRISSLNSSNAPDENTSSGHVGDFLYK